MTIAKSQLWKSDLEEAVAAFPEFSKLDGKTVLVTGATGLVCSTIVDLLLCCNGSLGTSVKIVAAVRSPEKAKRRFVVCNGNNTGLEILSYDATSYDANFNQPFDYIIHGASNAHPRVIAEEPVETLLSNLIGVKNLLDYALKCNAERFLLISSSEVYGSSKTGEPLTENDFGTIEILNPRNSYAIGKCGAEAMCAAYQSEYGLSTVIARPGHIYGPTASKTDSRVSSAWAYDVANGREIVMKSDGSQVRSYCYCIDCATAILSILINGENGAAYNISNPGESLSIRDLAVLFAKTGGVAITRASASFAEKRAFNPMQNSSLDCAALQGLGWRALFDAKRGVEHTVELLKDEW